MTIKVPPNAVRVWRGFRSPQLAESDFFERLGSVFIPATVLMQIENGLDVYIPTIPEGHPDKPATVPGETAVLFWETAEAHDRAFDTLASRTYTLTHGAVYTAESRADAPLLFSGDLIGNTSYYLFENPVDWMHADVNHLVAAPPADMSAETWYRRITTAVAGVQRRAHAEAAIVCATDTYLLYWQVGGASDPGFAELSGLGGWNETWQPAITSMDHGLWEDWPGMTVTSGASYNIQWTRRNES